MVVLLLTDTKLLSGRRNHPNGRGNLVQYIGYSCGCQQLGSFLSAFVPVPKPRAQVGTYAGDSAAGSKCASNLIVDICGLF